MAKKEDSGSGLRAGYSRADSNAPPLKKAIEKDELKPEKAPADKADDISADTVVQAAAGEDHQQAPTITMQGVSGKKITGVVKVVKRVAPKAETGEFESVPAVSAAPSSSETTDHVSASAANEPAPPAHSAAVSPVHASESAPAAKVAKKLPDTPAGHPLIEAAPAAQTVLAEPVHVQTAHAQIAQAQPETVQPVQEHPAPAQNAPSAAESMPVAATAKTPAVEQAVPVPPSPPQTPRPQVNPPSGPPAGGYPPGSYPPRPQGQDGYTPRAQGQGYSPRPLGQDGYTPRPQGQGPGGYAPRPQGQGSGGYPPRPQGQDGYAPRPQGQGTGGYPPRPQGQEGFAPRPQRPGPGQPGYPPGGYSQRPGPGQPGYPPGGYAPRPQGQDGYSPRPQGQGQGSGGFPQRPGPGQPGYPPGGYAPRPQGQGTGGYSPRPQGQGQGTGGYSPRPQSGTGGSGPRRSPGPEIPADLIGRPQARGNLAARDSFSKGPKRDDSKDARKPAVKNASPVNDKHGVLKKQTSTLPETGLSAVLTDETIMETIYSAPVRTSRPRGGRRRERGSIQASQAAVQRAILTHVTLPDNLTVKEFAEAIKKTSADIIKRLMRMGLMATLNQVIDFDTAAIIASEFNITAEKGVVVTEEDLLFDDTDDVEEDLVARPPVVVVMGHVDHGKTSLLDRIRSTSVASGEAGGITQHIGAYMVNANGRRITFLDTPGHEAFTTMRARGAQVTDIAILVVAADDGVMPQTIEAINHARAANTQIVVAINKIDLPGANIDKVKQELATRDLIPEEWGGSTIMVPVSAKTGEGIDELLEMVLLAADMLDLRTSPDKQAKGTIIEAKLDKSRGPVATLLVQRGTLMVGDSIVTGSVIGRVRAMTDFKGTVVKKAGPSTPVEITGLPEVPEAGELFYAVTDEKVARALAERRRMEQREQSLRQSSRMSLESLYTKMAAGEVKEINLIVKADVQGSVEAVRQSLEKLTNAEVRVNVIHGAVGAITEHDVRLAEVANAIIIGFNVRPATNVADMAADEGVDLRLYQIIYNAIEDVQAAMKGMLSPVYKETVLGHAEIRQIFIVTGSGTIAGCYVTDGRIVRSAEVRVVRAGTVVHTGKLLSLKRFKDDVREVATGYECGIAIEKFNDIKEGDILEAFEMTEVERS